MELDPDPRLIHRTRGYTSNPLVALVGEPEAVRAEALERIVDAAHDGELRAWATTRRRIAGELDHLRAHVHSPHVNRTARAIERELAALAEKLGA